MTRRALISVSDKRGVGPLGRALVKAGFELVSTGGTMRHLIESGLEVRSFADVTGSPEVMDGRVKTLHPAIHGGILFRRDDAAHVATLDDMGWTAIDLVVVNLYPFRETIARAGVSLADSVEQIDIGGPTMVRSAAKNFAHVAVVVDPDDYPDLIEALAERHQLSLQTRQRLALKAFQHTASYDAAISSYLAAVLPSEAPKPTRDETVAAATVFQILRYGENPHQSASAYGTDDRPLLGGAEPLQGKALSYNNLIDLDGAIQAVAEFDDTAAVIVKHTNPCGVGVSRDGHLLEAYERALAGDPTSAFGGIVALNRACTADIADLLVSRFFEVVVAPAFELAALAVLSAKKNLRVVALDPAQLCGQLRSSVRSTCVGVLVQSVDPRIQPAAEAEWRVATQVEPTDVARRALGFLWRVCKHVKSNAIVIGSGVRTFGIGAGQMSRVDAVKLAVEKSTGETRGAFLASDAFFPFRDNIDIAADAGITAIIQPGGSRRDPEVIEAANERGIAMIMTGRRHFRH